MKTIQEYLSGEYDEELRVLVAETRGWKRKEFTVVGHGSYFEWTKDDIYFLELPPPYSTSRDACEELLADLTEEEQLRFCDVLKSIVPKPAILDFELWEFLRATARQICVAYLIIKKILK